MRFAVALAFASFVTAQNTPQLRLPAFCGYAHPDAGAMQRDNKTGAVLSCRGELHFYFETTTPGEVHVAIERLDDAPAQQIELRIQLHPEGDGTPLTKGLEAGVMQSDVGSLILWQPGVHRAILKTTDGAPLQRVAALSFTGEAAAGARASTVERRNASSVHLWYDVPKEHRDDIEWFYCELTPRSDPLWTYYMATGWHRGYFGMQVNSPTERRVIFSVWDSGDEAVDRDKVAADDRVQLIAKGDDVHASGFGNEGTGGHSHLVHGWKLGDTFRFLVHAEPDEDNTHTTYTGWFWFADRGEAGEWGLIASFRAPKDGRFLHGLYSFSENFSGSNGDRHRACDYGNVWLRTKSGEWLPSIGAKFTHDGHGNEHRLDRRGGVRDGRFFLEHGDFATPTMPRGTALTLRRQSGNPPDTLPTVAAPR